MESRCRDSTTRGVPTLLKKILISFIGSIVVLLVIVILIGVLVDAEDNGEAVATDAKPVATVEPTKPAPTKTPVGLGVERDEIEDAFGSFDFEDAPLNDGRDRSLGESASGVMTLELIGDDFRLEQASLLMTVNVGENDAIPGYAQRFLSTVLPDWTGGLDWFEQGIIELADRSGQNVEIETRHGDTAITLTANKRFGWLTLSIEPTQGEPQAQKATATPERTSTPPTSFSTVMAQRNATPTTVPTSPAIAMRSSASDGESTRQPTSTPQPTPMPEVQGQQWLMPRQEMLVGDTGDNGLAPGKYEYRDDNGNTIVQGSSCYLKVNARDENRRDIKLTPGQPFTFVFRLTHKHVRLHYGSYLASCTGEWNGVGYGLYRIGP